MNPYLSLTRQFPGDDVRRFVEALGQWHDEMVLHRRLVERTGDHSACSEECPHAMGQQLWLEAQALLGPGADQLTFLRSCAAHPIPRA